MLIPDQHFIATLIFFMILSAFVYGVSVISDTIASMRNDRNIERNLGLFSAISALALTIIIVIARWEWGLL